MVSRRKGTHGEGAAEPDNMAVDRTKQNRTEQNRTKPALVAECSVPPDAALEEATLVPAVPGKLTLA